ncbi:MAG: inosine/xanthosine triphosphatase [Nanoarchaeota archaeon]|nr:inosine/xanthosine triphosphatase [Nanoarchaeota archaeon]
MIMKVGIATKNPSKIRAVEEIFKIAFGDVQILPSDADSGVPAQPKEEQILQGAINRARAALEGNDFGVGIEAGVFEIGGKLCNIGYCVIMDRTGKYSIGSQPIFELPEIFRKELLAGKELGTAADEYFKTKNIKHEGGSIKVLSNSLISRDDLLKDAIKCALVPWISKEIYDFDK